MKKFVMTVSALIVLLGASMAYSWDTSPFAKFNKWLGVGGYQIGDSMVSVTIGSAAYEGVSIKGASSQTGDYLQIQNSSGTEVFDITSAGAITPALTLTGALTVNDEVLIDADTTNAVALRVDGTSGQSVDIFHVRSYDATEYLDVASDGTIGLKTATTCGDTLTVTGKATVNDALFVNGDSDEVQLEIEGHSTQTNSVLSVQSYDDTVLLSVSNVGVTAISGATTISDELYVDADTTNAVALRVDGTSGQSVDIFHVRSYDATEYLDVASSGVIGLKTATTCGSALVTKGVTADPCTGTGYAAGAIFYNSTSGIMCYCDNNLVDLKIDGTSASCF